MTNTYGISQFTDATANNTADRFYRIGNVSGDLMLIPAGVFTMGDANNDNPGSDEHPTHDVLVSDFFMGPYEVSNDQMVEVLPWACEHGKISVTTTAETAC